MHSVFAARFCVFRLILLGVCMGSLGLLSPLQVHATSKKAKKASFSFFLQPYQGTEIKINGTIVKGKVLKKTNTLALLRVKLPKASKGQWALRFSHAKHQGLQKKLDVQKLRKYRRNPPLFQLMRPGSKHRLSYYWKVGRLPKSVTFLDNNRIAMALLDDSGTDIIQMHSGVRKRISPPFRKWGKHKGFVEGLVIKDVNELWISQMTRAAVHVFDLKTLKYKLSIKLRGLWTKTMTYDPRTKRVYCAHWVSRNISVVDVKTHKELFRIRTPGVPRSTVISKTNRRHLYAAIFQLDHKKIRYKAQVAKIDLRTRRLLKKMGPRGAKRHIVQDNRGRIYISDMARGRIEVYSTRTDRLLKRIRVYTNPNTIALSPDNKYLYVSCRGPNNRRSYYLKGHRMGRIYVIDTRTLKVVDYWEGGNQPTGIDVSPDGRYIVTSDFRDERIRVYERIELSKKP